MRHENSRIEVDFAPLRFDPVAEIYVLGGRSRAVGSKPSYAFKPLAPNGAARAPKRAGIRVPGLVGKTMQQISKLRNEGDVLWAGIIGSKGRRKMWV